jgi:TonB family protein
MRREFVLASLTLLADSLAAAQQTVPPVPSSASNPQSTPAVAYYAGPGVTAPGLLPLNTTIDQVRHCKKINGTAVLSAIVGASGIPSEIYFLRAIGSDLDKIALDVAADDRFKPGTHDGSPAPLVVSIEVNLAGCIEKTTDEAGQKTYILKLRSMPVQKINLQEPPLEGATLTLSGGVSQHDGNLLTGPYRVGGGITPPIPLITPEARYSVTARKKKIRGICLISLVVDAHGMPQNLQVIKSLEPTLDQNALYAVSQYRFKPSMKYAHPIPVLIHVEINFRLY